MRLTKSCPSPPFAIDRVTRSSGYRYLIQLARRRRRKYGWSPKGAMPGQILASVAALNIPHRHGAGPGPIALVGIDMFRVFPIGGASTCLGARVVVDAG